MNDSKSKFAPTAESERCRAEQRFIKALNLPDDPGAQLGLQDWTIEEMILLCQSEDLANPATALESKKVVDPDNGNS